MGRFVLLALFASALAPAAAASGWEEAAHSRARLIVAGTVEAGALAGRTDLPRRALLAGLEIELDPGWKTYWRTPGDGIAPQLDWSSSLNVATTQVLWPTPAHFRDAAGEYNGYADRVVLPVVIVPAQPGVPVALDLGLEYAVCKDVCIPVTKQMSKRLSGNGNDALERAAVLAALQEVPVRADANGRCGDLEIAEVRAELDGASPHLAVVFAHPADNAPRDLFIEAESGRFMAHPKRHSAGPERTLFHLDASTGGDPQGLAGQTLTLTAAAAPQSCEMTWTVE